MVRERPYNVLFLCTHNSARSLLAEAILNDPAVSRGRFRGYSAGSHPSGQPNPLALEQIRSAGLPVGEIRSKSRDEFTLPDAPEMDFVFTVCDNAANEVCPVWPGRPMTAHWGVADPSNAEGDDNSRRRAFAETFRILANRIRLFASLPLATLDRLSLQQKLHDIGGAGHSA